VAIKLALPKGRLQQATARLLERAGLRLTDYEQDSRSYRPRCPESPQLLIKVFQEKDIAIQVAIGNYDLGICGSEWVKELLAKYPSDAIVKVRELSYGRRELYAAASKFGGITSLPELKAKRAPVSIASEYPNLAESFALKLRLRRFKLFPIWGAAEAYPPENADLVIIPETSMGGLSRVSLVPLAAILNSTALLIANRIGIEQEDLSPILTLLCSADVEVEGAESASAICHSEEQSDEESRWGRGNSREILRFAQNDAQVYGDDVVSLALPDGHQQIPTTEFLRQAGFMLQGYEPSLPTRRPSVGLDGVTVKVIRPQDMPLQVANGNFDLAITGRDWLFDHRYHFPSSPVRELLDLGFGQVRIVAVTSENLPARNIADLRRLSSSGQFPMLRIASEYINTADKYARDNHLAPYKIIPTWGATEAFLPEDADILIENTQTGETLAKHNLKVIETLFESSACLIGNENPPQSSLKREKIACIIDAFQRARSI
jgi:ATP phosphoribosyltransferase